MSYIVAFVTFPESNMEYPVECFRADIYVGEQVIIRRGDGILRVGTINHAKFLNWDCKARIECKLQESSVDSGGNFILPKTSPVVKGITTTNSFRKELEINGWIPLKPKQRMYKSIMAYANTKYIGYIFCRKNGIDIQILPKQTNEVMQPYAPYEHSLSEGRVVRHSLAHTTFNLYEGVLRFSTSFSDNDENLDCFFKPQGDSDKRTKKLRQENEKKIKSSSSDLLDIYSVCSSGDGELAYLGDGIWVSPNGDFHDIGR